MVHNSSSMTEQRRRRPPMRPPPFVATPRANGRSWRSNIPTFVGTVIEQIGLPRAVARDHNRRRQSRHRALEVHSISTPQRSDDRPSELCNTRERSCPAAARTSGENDRASDRHRHRGARRDGRDARRRPVGCRRLSATNLGESPVLYACALHNKDMQGPDMLDVLPPQPAYCLMVRSDRSR